jgi:predicted RNase H-like HicB family nuclease
MKLPLTIKVFYEGTSKDAPWVSYNPEFKVASCGETPKKAEKNLKEAIRGVLKACDDIGTLEDLMQEAGFVVEDKKINLTRTKAKIENLEVSIPALSI